MSNQQSEKQSFPNTNLDRLCKTGSLYLVSNWSRMPLAMKRQINNEKNLIFPNSNLDRLGKTGTTSELHFSAMHKLC